MSVELSFISKQEVVRKIKEKYNLIKKKDKSGIIDNLVSLTGYDRKYLISQLNKSDLYKTRKLRVVNTLKYDEYLRSQLVKIWYATNKICSKRLVPYLPEIVPVLEVKGHIELNHVQRVQLLNISSSTVDRLLRTERKKFKKRGRTRTNSTPLLKRVIKIKTFNCDNKGTPGYFEADLVSHCGGNGDGQFINTLVVTDLHTQWTEFFPMVCKNAKEVVSALTEALLVLPYPILGLDTDNGSEFINTALLMFCQNNDIEFTRSRAYNKNDQAHVEEKNGSIIRKVVGYDRFEGIEAVNVLGRLYKTLRLYINYFQPSLKLISKERIGAKVSKSYDTAKTPYRRVIESVIEEQIKVKMTEEYQSLDPIILLREIKTLQEKLWQYAWEKQQRVKNEYNLLINDVTADLKVLKHKLKSQEKRKTKKEKLLDSINLKTYQSSRKPRKVSSRKRDWFVDIFVDVWEIEILPELENNSSIAATDIMKKLALKYPKKFHMSQLRTLQRRVAKWRDDQRLNQQENKSIIAKMKNFIKDSIDRREKNIYS